MISCHNPESLSVERTSAMLTSWLSYKDASSLQLRLQTGRLGKNETRVRVNWSWIGPPPPRQVGKCESWLYINMKFKSGAGTKSANVSANVDTLSLCILQTATTKKEKIRCDFCFTGFQNKWHKDTVWTFAAKKYVKYQKLHTHNHWRYSNTWVLSLLWC